MYGPANTWARLGAASSPEGGGDRRLQRHLRHPALGRQAGRADRCADRRCRGWCAHPTESYGMRFTDPSGATLVYSGDTGVLRRAGRPGARRRRVPVRGVVDAFDRRARRACTCPAPRRAGRRASRCARTVADAHPAVDVARGRHQRGQGRVRRTRCTRWCAARRSTSRRLPTTGDSCDEPTVGSERLGLARVQTRRRPARRRAAPGSHHPRLHLPSGRFGAGGVRSDPGHVHGKRHRGRAALAQGFGPGLADRGVRDAARRHP